MPSSSSRHFSDRTFQSAPISAESKKAIKHEFMSDVQAATIDVGLTGKDLLVQAKTGTGKTMAFLLPAIERLAKAGQPLKGISMLVLAPTRELALQIEQEALVLLKHHRNMSVGHVMGGTNNKQSLNTILKNPPTILIATPGRLHDHLTTPEVAHDVQAQFKGLRALVYDEADRLLDQGFKRELDGIFRVLPDRKIAKKTLSDDHEFVSTLLEDEANTHQHGTSALPLQISHTLTPASVPQSYVIAGFNDTFPLALRILQEDRLLHAKPDVNLSAPQNTKKALSKSKVIIFFPTARHVSVAYHLLSLLPGLPPVYEIHSRNSQSARTRASADFTKAEEAVLLSSDVAARGMDFPGVTLVVQVGLPSSTEQYIHRLGRTARAGEAGRGIIALDPQERFFLEKKDMSSLNIQASALDGADLSKERAEVSRALSSVDPERKSQAYRAWLGYYKTHLKMMKWTREELVCRANNFVRQALGWQGEDLPAIDPKTVGKMQLKGVPGLNIVRQAPINSEAQGRIMRSRA
ncbi:hypothetical protein C0992_002703 [Termitomyces sp. T32_za158]|nr:hypothetical protein C0992_002703 [Termitomyces sp. T32_za158]